VIDEVREGEAKAADEQPEDHAGDDIREREDGDQALTDRGAIEVGPDFCLLTRESRLSRGLYLHGPGRVRTQS